MTRRMFALAAAGFACTFAGCVRDSLHSAPMVAGKVVETPTVPQAAAETAERVDDVGTRLLDGTPLGIPLINFYTLGSQETELLHSDPKTLFISEGLVNRCGTDDQLAAVLALEAGKMTAEFRRSVRKQVKEPIPRVASAPKFDGTTDIDPARDAYLAQYDAAKQSPADKQDWPTVDPTAISEELLRNAGYDPKLLDEVTPWLKEATNGPNAHLMGKSAAPTWGR